MFSISKDISIAITSNSFIFQDSKGDVEPLEIPAYCFRSKDKLLALGEEARSLLGQETNSFSPKKVIEEGIIVDSEGAEEIIKKGLKNLKGILKTRVLCNVRFGAATHSIRNALKSNGVHNVYFVEHGLMSAVGLGLDITEPKIQAVLALEDDWFVFAVVSIGGTFCCKTKAIGVNDIVGDSIWYFKEKNKIQISFQQMLEKLSGSGLTGEFVANGWETWSGNSELGRNIKSNISADSLDIATFPSVTRISEYIKDCIQDLTKEQRSQLQFNGVSLCGEGAKIRNLSENLAKSTGLFFSNRNEKCHPVSIGLRNTLSDGKEFLDMLTRVTKT